MLVDPESAKIQLSHQYLFTLTGSTSLKAYHRMLVTLTPGVDFTNVLRKTFADPKSAK